MEEEIEFTDFMLLVQDIREYLRSNPDADMMCDDDDDPLRLKIGYKDNSSGKRWLIDIANIRGQCELIRRAFMTAEGKENLLRSFYPKKEAE